MHNEFKKKVMVIVPHEDDEINLAGATIKRAVEEDNDVYVIYLTNGDYSCKAEVRIKEAITACKLLGVKQDNIIFLGYPDEVDEKKHILYAKEPFVSKAGYSSTYGIKNQDEWCYKQRGIHREYICENIIEDIESVIQVFLPDVIIINGFEKHMDHKVLFLLFTNAIKRVFSTMQDYKPIIWLGFCYTTAWYSEKDYSSFNNKSTLISDYKYLNMHNLEWEKRLRLAVPRSCRTRLIKNNVLYRALRAHVSQWGLVHFESIINSDVVYWPLNREQIKALVGGKNVSVNFKKDAVLKQEKYEIDFIKITVNDEFVYTYYTKNNYVRLEVKGYNYKEGNISINNEDVIWKNSSYNLVDGINNIFLNKRKNVILCQLKENPLITDEIVIIKERIWDIVLKGIVEIINRVTYFVDRKVNRIKNEVRGYMKR